MKFCRLTDVHVLILISLFSGMAAGGERGSGGVDMRYVQLFIALGIHLTECSAFTLHLFHQDSQLVFLIYIALLILSCRSDSFRRDLKAALLFL